MKNIKLCIFDMDGLLIDSEKYIWQKGAIEIARSYGKKLDNSFFKKTVGSNRENYIKLLKQEFGNDFPGEEFHTKLLEHYAYACKNEKLILQPGVINILEYLKKHNIKLSVATQTDKELAYVALKNSKLYEYFDNVIYGDDVSKPKPNPDIYLKSIEHFNLNKEDCIIFEDSSIGAMAGYNAEIKVIMVPDTADPTNNDKTHAYAIIDSIDKAIPIIKKINNL